MFLKISQNSQETSSTRFSVFNEGLQLYWKRDLGADIFLWILWNLRTSFSQNSSKLNNFWLFKYIKEIKTCPDTVIKGIKAISIEAILVIFCQLWKWFCMLRKLWKPASRRTYQNLRNLEGKYLWRSFVIVKPFFLRFAVILLMILKLIILWNFILKLYLRSWSLPFSSWIVLAELWSANH